MASVINCDYSKVDIEAKCNELDLSEALRKKLVHKLKKFPKLFGGGLGKLEKIAPVELELREGSKPYHAKAAYSMLKAIIGVTKRNIKLMCDIGVSKNVTTVITQNGEHLRLCNRKRLATQEY